MKDNITVKLNQLFRENYIPNADEKCAFKAVQRLLGKYSKDINHHKLDDTSVLKYLQKNHLDDFFKLVLYCYGAIEGKDIYLLHEVEAYTYKWSIIIQGKEENLSDHILFIQEKKKINIVISKDKTPPIINKT